MHSRMTVNWKNGSESVIHNLRRLRRNRRFRRHVLLQIDASNAFNTISRQAILDEVLQHAPKLARWVHLSYGFASNLLFGEFVIMSGEGTQQGDPLGPLLFALALHPLILRIQSTLPVSFNRWYIDDGSIVVLREEAQSVLEFLQRHGEPLGFSINLTKTKAYALHASQHPLRLSCEFRNTGFCVLGSPIGDNSYVEGYLAAK